MARLFCIHKSSEGATYKDPLFGEHWDGAEAVGFVNSTYHFMRFDVPAAEQVGNFLDAIGDRRPRFHIALDCESEDGDGQTRETISQCILDSVAILQDITGWPPMIYARAGWWNYWTLPGTGTGLPLWVCDWNNNIPWLPRDWDTYLIHQYGGATVPGFLHPIDVNRFNGNEAAWQAYLAQFQDDPPPPPTPAPVFAQVINCTALNMRTQPYVNADTRITSVARGSTWLLTGAFAVEDDGTVWWEVVLARDEHYDKGRLCAWASSRYLQKVTVTAHNVYLPIVMKED